jgi:hypothetical protein
MTLDDQRATETRIDVDVVRADFLFLDVYVMFAGRNVDRSGRRSS